MADELTASAWKGFLKKLKPEPELDDSVLLKALAALAKAADGKPEQLDALDELTAALDKQGKVLSAAKKALGDKTHDAIRKQLEELANETRVRHKETEKVIAALKAAATEEDDESPTILTSKMVPLLKEVRKPDVVMQALVAVAGKETVVLLSRRAISPARGKVLKEAMKTPSGIKFMRAECLFEKNAVTFVFENVVGGLARKISAALLEQTGQRVKVRVRGEDPAEVDEDLDAPDPVPEASSASAGPVQTPTPTPTPTPTEPDPLRTRYERRIEALQPDIAKLSQTADTPNAGKARALLAFAQEKAEAGTYAAALRALDALEPLLGVAPPQQQQAASTEQAIDPDLGKPGKAGLMAAWRQQRAGTVTTLKALATRIAKAGHRRSVPAIEEIKTIIDRLVAEPANRKQASELRIWLASNDLVHDICELEEDIRTPLTQALQALEPELAA
ncbi:MAG TPA: hypothetical protein VGM81_17475 [Burkholderiaceae bacterium]|jgi:hypothetical protein